MHNISVPLCVYLILTVLRGLAIAMFQLLNHELMVFFIH